VNLKVGDRVNFLNEKGGGIVSKIVDNNVVQVTIEDGFDIPVMISDLIKTGITDDIEKAYKKLHPEIEIQPEDEDVFPLFLAHNSPEQRAAGLYFAIIPQTPETPLVGSLDLYLVNHTDYNILFGIFESLAGSYSGSDYGVLEPESRLFLKSIGRSEIEAWANSLLQVTFFKENKCEPVAPFSGLITFRPIKLYKEESFKYESLLRTKAFVTEVCKLSDIARKPLFEESLSQENLRLLQEKMQLNQAKPNPEKNSMLEKHKIDDTVAEVDLHIGELVDNFTNLEKNDLLQIQLQYFKNCMEEAYKEKISKVIFIHGVGNGKLKTEIYSYLQTREGIEYYDAPYARYGMGATEVNFYRNKR
jgi:hypothetical protein